MYNLTLCKVAAASILRMIWVKKCAMLFMSALKLRVRIIMVQRHIPQQFRYIVAVSCVGGGTMRTR